MFRRSSTAVRHEIPIYFDLRAPGAVQDEVARLERLGATVTARYSRSVVMADPEGNEFCVEPGHGHEALR